MNFRETFYLAIFILYQLLAVSGGIIKELWQNMLQLDQLPKEVDEALWSKGKAILEKGTCAAHFEMSQVSVVMEPALGFKWGRESTDPTSDVICRLLAQPLHFRVAAERYFDILASRGRVMRVYRCLLALDIKVKAGNRKNDDVARVNLNIIFGIQIRERKYYLLTDNQGMPGNSLDLIAYDLTTGKLIAFENTLTCLQSAETVEWTKKLLTEHYKGRNLDDLKTCFVANKNQIVTSSKSIREIRTKKNVAQTIPKDIFKCVKNFYRDDLKTCFAANQKQVATREAATSSKSNRETGKINNGTLEMDPNRKNKQLAIPENANSMKFLKTKNATKHLNLSRFAQMSIHPISLMGKSREKKGVSTTKSITQKEKQVQGEEEASTSYEIPKKKEKTTKSVRFDPNL